MQIVSFQPEHISQAAELLAGRQRRDRALEKGLPASFEDPAAAARALQTSLERSQAAGFAALEHGRLAAYLIGDRVIDNIWGRSAWVRSAGCAYDPASGVEIVRDLYAALGEQWVRSGIFLHYVQIPLCDAQLVQAWFSLSFGIEHVYALADLAALDPAAPVIPPEIELRKAGLAERGLLGKLADVIWRQQVRAPVWAVQMPETIRENLEAWESSVDEADVSAWLAISAGAVLGSQGYWPAESALGAANDNLFIPEKCAHMSLAGTLPEQRGRGVGRLLSRFVLAQMYVEGYRYADTEWRSTNLLASRFWPHQGYHPVAYRLARRIDERIAWADGLE